MDIRTPLFTVCLRLRVNLANRTRAATVTITTVITVTVATDQLHRPETYARDSLADLVKFGIVSGKDGKLAPDDTLTRAEAAVIVYRIWNL
ncbi:MULTISPECIES: S-layer homology domain-containing protein [unclassified Paenibacillus]|uniref:S-layer homology domain-containing protein n=1 Tax=unclassified Paenibacillus TaxID=185978 RepID=UPI0036D31241